MDPNWFYSTLAQSTAAIVGLAGGFLFQRVLAQRQALGPQRDELRRQFVEQAREIRIVREMCLIVEASLRKARTAIESAGDTRLATLPRDLELIEPSLGTRVHSEPGDWPHDPWKVLDDGIEACRPFESYSLRLTRGSRNFCSVAATSMRAALLG